MPHTEQTKATGPIGGPPMYRFNIASSHNGIDRTILAATMEDFLDQMEEVTARQLADSSFFLYERAFEIWDEDKQRWRGTPADHFLRAIVMTYETAVGAVFKDWAETHAKYKEVEKEIQEEHGGGTTGGNQENDAVSVQ